jgi:hypothetical protein
MTLDIGKMFKKFCRIILDVIYILASYYLHALDHTQLRFLLDTFK